MQWIRQFSLAFTACLLSGAALAATEGKEPAKLLHVYTTPSMATPLAGALRDYTRKTGIAVSVECGDPAALIRNIASGEAADLFIAESPEAFSTLKNMGMIDVYSQSVLMQNALVLIGPRVAPEPETAEALLRYYFEQGVPVYYLAPDASLPGQTAKAWIDAHMPENPPAVVPSPVASMAELLEIRKRGAGAIVVYKTDRVRDAESISLPATLAEREAITYQAAVVASEYMKESRALLAFIKSPATRSYFSSIGFTTPDRPQSSGAEQP